MPAQDIYEMLWDTCERLRKRDPGLLNKVLSTRTRIWYQNQRALREHQGQSED